VLPGLRHSPVAATPLQVRRNRRLVVSQVSTFANYEYAMYWNFYIVRTAAWDYAMFVFILGLFHQADPNSGSAAMKLHSSCILFGFDLASRPRDRILARGLNPPRRKR
jgi:hypothetical protein